MTPEAQATIASLRAKDAAGQLLTIEDMQMVTKLLRAGRLQASIASDASRRKSAKAAVVDGKGLLDALDALEGLES